MKSIISRLYSLFQSKDDSIKNVIIKEEKSRIITIKDLEICDDVFLKIDHKVHNAWITSIGRKSILVCYTDENKQFKEIRFITDGFLDKSIITEGNRVLILNKKNIK